MITAADRRPHDFPGRQSQDTLSTFGHSATIAAQSMWTRSTGHVSHVWAASKDVMCCRWEDCGLDGWQ